MTTETASFSPATLKAGDLITLTGYGADCGQTKDVRVLRVSPKSISVTRTDGDGEPTRYSRRDGLASELYSQVMGFMLPAPLVDLKDEVYLGPGRGWGIV